MIGKSGSRMGSVGALFVKLVSAAGAGILHDFPKEVALEPRQSERAGTRAGKIEVLMTILQDRDDQQSQA
jgi:hypothetical protein